MKRIYCIHKDTYSVYLRLDQITRIHIYKDEDETLDSYVNVRGENFQVPAKEATKIKDLWIREMEEQNRLTMGD